jgi:hypothetical protein
MLMLIRKTKVLLCCHDLPFPFTTTSSSAACYSAPPPGLYSLSVHVCIVQLCLDIVAAPLEVVHFAADPFDASHGIHLHAPSCTYTACYLLNQEPLSFLKLPPHAVSTRPR